MAKKKRNRKAQDATLINVNALKKIVAQLSRELKASRKAKR